MDKKVLILYVPVLHQGYINLFEKLKKDIEVIYIVGQDLISEFTHLEKEIRAIKPELAARFISALCFFQNVRILNLEDLVCLGGCSIVLADDSFSRNLSEKYLKGFDVVFEDVFLRWDEKHVAIQKPIETFTVSNDPFSKEVMHLARKEGLRSSDWWRRVGSLVLRDGNAILVGHNQHLPSEHSPYVLGDIRDFIKAGEMIDISSSLHSEKVIITMAARKGIALEGADLYVSTFPCSDCANWVAFSGIKRCFFGGGHASFQGESVLRSFGVELIYVE